MTRKRIPVRGLRAVKKSLLFTWKKNVLNKTYVSWGSKLSLFLHFSVKCKENDFHRKYSFWGGPAENLSSATISQLEQNWWLYFIYKAKDQSVTGSIFKIRKKNGKIFFKKFPNFSRFYAYFLMFCIFFIGYRWKTKKLRLLRSRAFNSL